MTQERTGDKFAPKRLASSGEDIEVKGHCRDVGVKTWVNWWGMRSQVNTNTTRSLLMTTIIICLGGQILALFKVSLQYILDLRAYMYSTY